MFLYQELDPFDAIYFIKSGPVGYVHPRFNNYIYHKRLGGNHHGFEDLIYNQQKSLPKEMRDQEITVKTLARFVRKGKLGKRRFSVMTI